MIKARDGNFTSAVSKTNEWLNEIEKEMQTSDRQKSYQTLKVVLHALRDRLTVDETAHLGAQLPLLIRGIYYEDWQPTRKMEKIHSQREFIESIEDKLLQGTNAEQAVQSVFKIINQHVTKGEIDDIKSVMPDSLLAYWP